MRITGKGDQTINAFYDSVAFSNDGRITQLGNFHGFGNVDSTKYFVLKYIRTRFNFVHLRNENFKLDNCYLFKGDGFRNHLNADPTPNFFGQSESTPESYDNVSIFHFFNILIPIFSYCSSTRKYIHCSLP